MIRTRVPLEELADRVAQRRDVIVSGRWWTYDVASVHHHRQPNVARSDPATTVDHERCGRQAAVDDPGRVKVGHGLSHVDGDDEPPLGVGVRDLHPGDVHLEHGQMPVDGRDVDGRTSHAVGRQAFGESAHCRLRSRIAA